FRPNLVLVDHMPGGANRELVPALRLIRALNYSTRVVLGVRDIIDDPAVTCAVWQREGFYDTLRRYYDSVLIYGSPDVFATAAKELGVQVRTSVSDSLSHLNAADLVVSMAGYNTVSEILRFRKRAILVPRPGPSLEQRMRARIFSERGLVTAIEPEDLSAPRLATAIMESL